MYIQNEINIRGSWLTWLADMRIDDCKVADPKDRNKIAVAITNGFHKKGLAKFTVKLNKQNKQELLITRVK